MAQEEKRRDRKVTRRKKSKIAVAKKSPKTAASKQGPNGFCSTAKVNLQADVFVGTEIRFELKMQKFCFLENENQRYLKKHGGEGNLKLRSR